MFKQFNQFNQFRQIDLYNHSNQACVRLCCLFVVCVWLCCLCLLSCCVLLCAILGWSFVCSCVLRLSCIECAFSKNESAGVTHTHARLLLGRLLTLQLGWPPFRGPSVQAVQSVQSVCSGHTGTRRHGDARPYPLSVIRSDLAQFREYVRLTITTFRRTNDWATHR